MPPRLNRPWKPDIIERPLARSTMMAWKFIATSIAPTPAPNNISVSTSDGNAERVARKGIVVATTRVAATMTRQQPNLAARAPASGIVTIEPTPRHSRSSPSAPSLISARALANGTSAAHAELPKPVMKKTIRVARCSATPGICSAMVSEIAIDTCLPPASMMRHLCSWPISQDA